MNSRQQRKLFIAAIGVAMLGAIFLAYRAFNENLLYFYSPTQVFAGEAPVDRQFRLGGLVEEGSVYREPGSLKVDFVVTDMANDVAATYTGVLPDLFVEGKGVVAHGTIDGDGVFVAHKVLAKHDENYMSPEVARALADAEAASASESSAAP